MAIQRAEPTGPEPTGPELTGPEEDEERGSWHLRSGGAWGFALTLWLAGLGGTVLFARDGVEVAMARWVGIPGTVTIDTCAHTRSYALCYGPFDATKGSVHVKRLELRTIRHDQPGRQDKTWLRSRSARHAWASDVSPWSQLIPVIPFALLAVVQSVWISLSWRAWRRRLRTRQGAGDGRTSGWQDRRVRSRRVSPQHKGR